MLPVRQSDGTSRRSSILKPPKLRQPLQNVDFDPPSSENSPTLAKLQKRRVSFAEKKHVKEFCDLMEQGTLWDNTYEEHELSNARIGQALNIDGSITQNMNMTNIVNELEDNQPCTSIENNVDSLAVSDNPAINVEDCCLLLGQAEEILTNVTTDVDVNKFDDSLDLTGVCGVEVTGVMQNVECFEPIEMKENIPPNLGGCSKKLITIVKENYVSSEKFPLVNETRIFQDESIEVSAAVPVSALEQIQNLHEIPCSEFTFLNCPSLKLHEKTPSQYELASKERGHTSTEKTEVFRDEPMEFTTAIQCSSLSSLQANIRSDEIKFNEHIHAEVCSNSGKISSSAKIDGPEFIENIKMTPPRVSVTLAKDVLPKASDFEKPRLLAEHERTPAHNSLLVSHIQPPLQIESNSLRHGYTRMNESKVLLDESMEFTVAISASPVSALQANNCTVEFQNDSQKTNYDSIDLSKTECVKNVGMASFTAANIAEDDAPPKASIFEQVRTIIKRKQIPVDDSPLKPHKKSLLQIESYQPEQENARTEVTNVFRDEPMEFTVAISSSVAQSGPDVFSDKTNCAEQFPSLHENNEGGSYAVNQTVMQVQDIQSTPDRVIQSSPSETSFKETDSMLSKTLSVLDESHTIDGKNIGISSLKNYDGKTYIIDQCAKPSREIPTTSNVAEATELEYFVKRANELEDELLLDTINFVEHTSQPSFDLEENSGESAANTESYTADKMKRSATFVIATNKADSEKMIEDDNHNDSNENRDMCENIKRWTEIVTVKRSETFVISSENLNSRQELITGHVQNQPSLPLTTIQCTDSDTNVQLHAVSLVEERVIADSSENKRCLDESKLTENIKTTQNNCDASKLSSVDLNNSLEEEYIPNTSCNCKGVQEFKSDTSHNHSTNNEVLVEDGLGKCDDSIVEDPFLKFIRNIEAISRCDKCIWQLRSLNEKMMAVDFISNSLVVVILFRSNENSDPTMSTLQNIRIISRLTDKTEDLLRMVHHLIQLKLNTDKLLFSYKKCEDIFLLLDHISNEVKFFMDFMFELRRLDDLYLMDIVGDRLSYIIQSKRMGIILKVMVHVKLFNEIGPKDIDVSCLLGKVRVDDVKQLITSVKRDYKFLSRYVNDVQRYIEVMEDSG